MLLTSELALTYDFDSAAYVLYKIRGGTAQLGYYVSTFDQWTPGFELQFGTFAAQYIRIDAASYLTKAACGYVGMLYAGACDVDFTQQTDYFTWMECQAALRPQSSVRYDTSKLCPLKIAADHHTHVRPDELHAVIGPDVPSEIVCLIDCLVSSDGTVSAATYTTISLYYYLAPQHVKLIFCEIVRELEAASMLCRKGLKSVSTLLKQSLHVYRHDLTYLFELNVLENRVTDEVDWEQERMNRVDPTTVPLTYQQVYDAARAMFGAAKNSGKQPRATEWAEYWAMRWGNMPAGSYSSQYQADKDDASGIPHIHRSKASVISSVGARGFEYYAKRQPEIRASTSTKYEWGKTRALYGCDITSFLMADFPMRDCEETLPQRCLTGRLATPQYVMRRMKVLARAVPVCYDFDDFNSQHSTTSMQAVIKAWGDVFKEQLSADQHCAVLWTHDSLSHSYYVNNETKATVITKGTLFSGWRLTSFMNTVLNFIYLQQAGLDEVTLHSFHNGDDVFACTVYIRQAFQLVRRAAKLGIRAQVAKMNIGTVGEFLRVDGLATDPTMTQYLSRACATFVHGRIESHVGLDALAELTALKDRSEALVARGGDARIAAALEAGLISNIAKRYEMTLDDVRTFYKLHPIQGGCDPKAPIGSQRIQRIPFRMINDGAGSDVAERMWLGASDYLNHMAKKYGIPLDDVSRKQIRAANKKIARMISTKFEIVREKRKNLMVWRSQFGIYRETSIHRVFERARLLGVLTPQMCENFSYSQIQEILSSPHAYEYISAIA